MNFQAKLNANNNKTCHAHTYLCAVLSSSGHKGLPGERGVAGDPGEQGPAGPTGEKGDTGERGPAGERGTPGASPPVPTLVAFSVARTTNLETSWSATVVRYDDVLSNVGGAYDIATGRFVTKVSGVYLFTFTAMTTKEYILQLKKNGKTMVSMREKHTFDNQASSNSAILRLGTGDRVWVEMFPGRHSLFSKGNRNTFSGFLISQLKSPFILKQKDGLYFFPVCVQKSLNARTFLALTSLRQLKHLKMAQTKVSFASLVLLGSVMIQVASPHELNVEEGSCSKQFSSDVNITVVAAPGPAGPQGDMGPRGKFTRTGSCSKQFSSDVNITVVAAPGPAGPKGDMGPRGKLTRTGSCSKQFSSDVNITVVAAPGPAGPKGDMGPRGKFTRTGSCSKQFSSDVNITVVAAPGQAGPKGDMGPRGHKGTPGEKGVAGDPGEQGPAGPTGEKGDTGERGPAGETGTPGVSPPVPTLVAFSVARTTNLESSNSSGTVVTYDDVLSNVGGAYDMATGKFVTKVGGMYYFTFSGMTKVIYALELKKNGEMIVSMYESYPGERQSSSNSAIVQLETGDAVWVELKMGENTLLSNGNRYVTFSGFLINQA
ncbi:uncharacterized protein [Branchiostoma lanceolatum]|uniref:uncharacterized protein n=1 Tax=Branchiostoma lanceolatum TaxID=7740 RepID=UPI003451F38F